jgi:2-iminoacetate synthase ThiH
MNHKVLYISQFTENCLLCCSFCNFSKRNNTYEYFLDKIKKIYHNILENEPKQ